MSKIDRSGGVLDSATAPVRVTMLGIRGFPNVQGGVENHAQNLALHLTELGCEVEAVVRSAYVPREKGSEWNKVKITRVWAPRRSGFEALVHTLLGVTIAAWRRPDIVHIHCIGPALLAPVARLCGLKVVVTHHVLNYENEKWGYFGRSILRLGEYVGMIFANGRIAVSQGLARYVEQRYNKKTYFIPNGINNPTPTKETTVLSRFELERGRYILMVARIDEQKRQMDLIEAFARIKKPSWRLALVGGADYSSGYAQKVIEAADSTPGVVLLGQQSGEALAQLYTHAGLFVLPSSHEGQPIAALEAMSYGCPVTLSDIPANREIATRNVQFIEVGNIDRLEAHLRELFDNERPARLDADELEQIRSRHDWRQIAIETLRLYNSARGADGRRAARPKSPAPDAPPRFS